MMMMMMHALQYGMDGRSRKVRKYRKYVVRKVCTQWMAFIMTYLVKQKQHTSLRSVFRLRIRDYVADKLRSKSFGWDCFIFEYFVTFSQFAILLGNQRVESYFEHAIQKSMCFQKVTSSIPKQSDEANAVLSTWSSSTHQEFSLDLYLHTQQQ